MTKMDVYDAGKVKSLKNLPINVCARLLGMKSFFNIGFIGTFFKSICIIFKKKKNKQKNIYCIYLLITTQYIY